MLRSRVPQIARTETGRSPPVREDVEWREGVDGDVEGGCGGRVWRVDVEGGCGGWVWRV